MTGKQKDLVETRDKGDAGKRSRPKSKACRETIFKQHIFKYLSKRCQT